VIEPATIAASMVIVRPEAIDAALGLAKPQRSGGRRL